MLKVVFWALVGNFLLILSLFFVPPVQELLQGPAFLIPLITFSLLGAALFFQTLKTKKAGPLRKFLLLTGGSATAFFIGVLLHNLLYGLAIISQNLLLIKSLAEILHVAFFLIATIACPLGFLIGTVASIILLIRKKNKDN